jgi:hypothetical protein
MINISELYNQQENNNKRKESIYKEVLTKCHHRIKLTAKMYPDNCYCYYTIPKILYGVPLYNLEDCLKYMSENLIENGFKVYYTHPNLLYITWFKSDTKNNSNSNNKKIETKHIMQNYKSIEDYKPSGNLIYNTNSLELLNKKKNKLFS